MSLLILADNPAFRDTAMREARRAFLGKSGLLFSGAAVALLAGRDALAAKGDKSTASDVRILNTALGAELEAIAAYQVGAESGLLQKPVLDLAVTFQGHHKEHADLLAKTIAKLGGKAVSAKSKYTFPTETLKTQADVLRFAAISREGRRQRLSRRRARVQQPRPGQGRRKHPRRRGDALGDPAQRGGRSPGSVGIRVLSVSRQARLPGWRCARCFGGRGAPDGRRATRARARRSTAAASPVMRSPTTAPGPGTAACSAAARAA